MTILISRLMQTAFLVLLVPISAAHASKVYRWVDESGQVHYSSRPPSTESKPGNNTTNSATPPSATKIETMELKGNPKAPQVKVKNNYAYCGEEKLPGPVDNPLAILSGIQAQLSDWKEQLKSKEKELAQFNKDRLRSMAKYGAGTNLSHAQRKRKRLQSKIDNYRCRIEWAQKQELGLATDRKHILAAPGRVTGKLASVENEQDLACGKTTVYFPNQPEYLDWYKCREPFQKKLYKLRRELRNSQRNAAKLD